MNNKQLRLIWSNFKLRNVRYIIQGFWRRYVLKEKYALKAEYKKMICPDCWNEGYCVGGIDPETNEFVEGCGCFVEELFYSDKPCTANRF
jgi:hypothetical protein